MTVNLAKTVDVFDSRPCILGEGVFWNPYLKQVFWFDIKAMSLFSSDNGRGLEWQFKEYVSAAHVVDKHNLLLASESGLHAFNTQTGLGVDFCDVERCNSETRSNDGRSDPWGGFWFSTMGKKAEHGVGSIYRYFDGEVIKVRSGLTIPNSICFDDANALVYYSDTPTQLIWRQTLEQGTGCVSGGAEVFLDLRDFDFKPDGAVVDVFGNLWVALWGSAKVACFNKNGLFIGWVDVPAKNVTCPLIVNEKLYITSALDGLSQQDIETYPYSGMTFEVSLKFNQLNSLN